MRRLNTSTISSTGSICCSPNPSYSTSAAPFDIGLCVGVRKGGYGGKPGFPSVSFSRLGRSRMAAPARFVAVEQSLERREVEPRLVGAFLHLAPGFHRDRFRHDA